MRLILGAPESDRIEITAVELIVGAKPAGGNESFLPPLAFLFPCRVLC